MDNTNIKKNITNTLLNICLGLVLEQETPKSQWVPPHGMLTGCLVLCSPVLKNSRCVGLPKALHTRKRRRYLEDSPMQNEGKTHRNQGWLLVRPREIYVYIPIHLSVYQSLHPIIYCIRIYYIYIIIYIYIPDTLRVQYGKDWYPTVFWPHDLGHRVETPRKPESQNPVCEPRVS